MKANESKNYNKIQRCDRRKINNQIPHNSKLNNLKSNKYFTVDNNENSMKKALTKYREKNNTINNASKTHQSNISSSDSSKLYPIRIKLHKNVSLKLDKKILNYAEPRTKVKEFHKIQPKIIDNSILDVENFNSFFENDNNNNEFNNINIINDEKSNKIISDNSNKNKNIKYKKENILIDLNNIDSNDNNINNIINDENNDIHFSKGFEKETNTLENNNNCINKIIKEIEFFSTDFEDNKNLLHSLDIKLINFDYILKMEKLYNELIKDIEINKMEIYQNKLSIVKDFLFIYNSQSNINLYNIIDNMILNDDCSQMANKTYIKSKSNKLNLKNSNDNIFLIIKEFLIEQFVFFYILILIALIKKEKNNFHSGLHNLTFYFHQNIIVFIYIIFSNFNINKNCYCNDDLESINNYEKCMKILNDNKTWLDKNNYKKYIKTNNKLSKQILINLLTQIKLYFKKNPYTENNNNFLETSIDLLKSYLLSFQKKKITNILKEIKDSSSITNLLESIKINKILSQYTEENNKNTNNIDNNNNIFAKKKDENEIDEECNIDSSSESMPKPPFLKPISPKYKYTLALDLDETLVHYISDNESAYIQIRPGTEEFIKDLAEYFEIVIFTAALKTYADLVIDGIDPDGAISDRLYRQHTISVGNVNLKDLDKLGRDIRHVIIIDNCLENFALQPKNGLNILDFEGNEYDDELNYLKKDLIKLVKLNPDDVRFYLKDIQIEMDKRAIFFQNLNNENNCESELVNTNLNSEENNNLFSEIIKKDEIISDNNEHLGFIYSDGAENIEEEKI